MPIKIVERQKQKQFFIMINNAISSQPLTLTSGNKACLHTVVLFLYLGVPAPFPFAPLIIKWGRQCKILLRGVSDWKVEELNGCLMFAVWIGYCFVTLVFVWKFSSTSLITICHIYVLVSNTSTRHQSGRYSGARSYSKKVVSTMPAMCHFRIV